MSPWSAHLLCSPLWLAARIIGAKINADATVSGILKKRKKNLLPCIRAGCVIFTDELANLKEEERLLELLGIDAGKPIMYEGFHDFLQFRIRGRLPQDREKCSKSYGAKSKHMDKPTLCMLSYKANAMPVLYLTMDVQ